MKRFLKDKKGVFGLTAVQSFFAIVLGIALLAYVIIIIMGTLSSSSILPQLTATTINESGYCNGTGYLLNNYNLSGFAPALSQITNKSNAVIINAANCTLIGNYVYNTTAVAWNSTLITYTYSYDSDAQKQLIGVSGNVSTGITGFFTSINPVYAILAILVIILVLLVLVRVIQPNQSRTTEI